MTVKNILCAYSGENANHSGLHYAIKLANHYDAWLTGTVLHGRSFWEKRLYTAATEQIINTLRQNDNKRIEKITHKFNDLVKEFGNIEKSEFIDLDPEKDPALAEYAHCFDIVVMGNHSVKLDEAHFSAHPDLVAIKSGRPILVVPNGYKSEGLASHALIAWDGKRSAARAVGDAMQFLEEKAKITVLTIGERTNNTIEGSGGILTLFRRHGINVEHIHSRNSRSPAKIILNTCKKIEAELIVMGAFERSKFTHELFGGITTDVMHDATVPVFLSH